MHGHVSRPWKQELGARYHGTGPDLATSVRKNNVAECRLDSPTRKLEGVEWISLRNCALRHHLFALLTTPRKYVLGGLTLTCGPRQKHTVSFRAVCRLKVLLELVPLSRFV